MVIKLGEVSREMLSKWRKDLNHKKYEDVVREVSGIAIIFRGENDKMWMETVQTLRQDVNEMSDRRMPAHIRVYLKDLFDDAVRTIKGELRRDKMRKRMQETFKLLSRANSS